MRRSELFTLLIILAVAAGVRLYHLGSAPSRLTPAEVVSGNAAARVASSGSFRVFYPDGGGREGLFINLQAIVVRSAGFSPWSLRLVPALAGILTVLGTYFLVRRLLDNWEPAAMTAFLLAVSAWHVHVSRLGISAALVPLAAVWGLYFLYTALRTHRLWHWLLAGISFGLGFHASGEFRMMPAVIIALIIACFWGIAADFAHDKYRYTRHQLWGGMALMVGVMILFVLPLLPYWYVNEATLWNNPVSTALRTLGTLLDGTALSWPVSALFAVGLIRIFFKMGRALRTHGHPTVVQILLAAWLFFGLLPGIMAIPVVYIIAGEGLWWLFVWLRHWYGQHDPHRHEGTIVATFTLLAFLLAVGVAQMGPYFNGTRLP